jgi:hypothetical protein
LGLWPYYIFWFSFVQSEGRQNGYKTTLVKELKMDAIFAAVDLTTVAAFVTGAMVIVIGVAMAFKGGILGKRAIKAV